MIDVYYKRICRLLESEDEGETGPWKEDDFSDEASFLFRSSFSSKGSSIKYERTEGGGGSRPMRTHCVHGGRGVRAAAYVRIFFKYSANVFIFDKYIIVEYKHICIKETIYKLCIILSIYP